MERFLWHPASASSLWLFRRRNAVAQLRGHQDDHECNKVHDEDEKQYHLHAAHLHPHCAIAEMSEATVSDGDGWCEVTSALSLSLRAERRKSPPLFGNPATSLLGRPLGFASPSYDGFAFVEGESSRSRHRCTPRRVPKYIRRRPEASARWPFLAITRTYWTGATQESRQDTLRQAR